jgi:prepilin-type N-terminal cleavage/methylation domain-containing protein
MKKIIIHQKERGFTIVELLIATAVLSTILVLTTVIMINIGNLYYKGINQARVQDAVRNVSDGLTQNLSLDDANAIYASKNITFHGNSYKTEAYCIGTTRYTFIKGVQIGDNWTSTQPQVPHVMWRDNVTSGSCGTADITSPGLSGGSELMPPNSSLAEFCITGTGSSNCQSGASPYTVQIALAYGDNDLLIPSPPLGMNVHCKGSTGDQYCAVATSQTTVVKRL